MRTISVVVPCLDEAEALPDTIPVLTSLLASLEKQGKIASESSIYFIDDGSTDDTWAVICRFSKSEPRVHGLKLSRNYGHQKALLAGILNAPGDLVITMDADLQDDPRVVPRMLEAHHLGAEIVFGVRSDRRSDTVFKRASAHAYYKLLRWLGVDMIEGHAEYRLLSRRA